jgi:hypothetical protein
LAQRLVLDFLGAVERHGAFGEPVADDTVNIAILSQVASGPLAVGEAARASCDPDRSFKQRHCDLCTVGVRDEMLCLGSSSSVSIHRRLTAKVRKAFNAICLSPLPRYINGLFMPSTRDQTSVRLR